MSVSDVNDVVPQFTERSYRVRIPDMPPGTYDIPLYRVLAFDDDVGPNADIDYSIKTGRGNGRFKINPKTGVITSQKDFESGMQYDLTVSMCISILTKLVSLQLTLLRNFTSVVTETAFEYSAVERIN